ncbi:MAG: hypothetical protein KDE19_24005 [Caldilineaceae bacterium]|nr:hypothetical protein [Caldilineaceae bacterium]
MESLFSMEYLMSIDSVLCAVGGLVIGFLFWQFLRSWRLGLVVNLILGAVGGVVSGAVINQLDVMNVGDYADPIIAGLLGGVLLVGIAGLLRR